MMTSGPTGGLLGVFAVLLIAPAVAYAQTDYYNHWLAVQGGVLASASRIGPPWRGIRSGPETVAPRRLARPAHTVVVAEHDALVDLRRQVCGVGTPPSTGGRKSTSTKSTPAG